MIRKQYFLIAISIFLISITGFKAIDNPSFLKKLIEKVQSYNASYPEEKVYLQIDKPFYKPGEDIWFNAFILNSSSHQPTSISEVVYVELIDPKGNVTSKVELVIKEGTAHGDFALQNTAPGGLYHIRAYTQWMKNFGEENIFKKEIQVQRITTPRLLLKLDYEKESYGPGDRVNAKLTVTNLKNEKVSKASVAFSVKLRGIKITDAQLFSDVNGSALLSFQLPDSLTTTDGLLQAIITTQGIEESISRSIPIVLNKITIQFFPEGGHLIENVNTTIAFKALNEFGKGADITGSILDDHNSIVAKFESFHMGMGAFEFKPLQGKKYFVRIDTPSGSKSMTRLPEALQEGYSFNLIESKATITKWSIHAPISGYVNLVSQVHGNVVDTSRVNLTKGENTIQIVTETFPAGIATFTLFNEKGIEQCERLAFVNSEKGLNIKLIPDKQSYLPREKVQLKIETSDNQGNPIPAKLSLAVVDDQLISFADDKQDNILSALLLSSEVKGEIQEPSFYFDKNEPKASKALDYLLMTQGWRRFSWKNINESKRVITYSPEKVKNLAGKIVDSRKNGVAAKVTLLEIGNKCRIKNLETTKDGYFLFKNIDPTIPILLLTRKPAEIEIQKEKTFSISLNDKEGTLILPEVSTDAIGQISNMDKKNNANDITPENGLDMSLGEDVSSLNEVIVVGYGTENKKYLTSSVVTITTENTIEGRFSAPSFENLLQGRVAGVTVQPLSGNPGAPSNVAIRGMSSLAGRAEPLYVIDGHPITGSLNQNFSNGSLFGPDNIQTIEILHSPEATALFGSAAANGVILITTRSRFWYPYFQSKKKPARYSSITVTPRKFSPTREFYTPPPSTTQKSSREDFPSTLYWNHTLVTNQQGKATLSFYNSDAVSAFRVTAEGFTASGLIGHSEEVYHTQLPFSIDAKFPEFLGFEDVLKLPVNIKNETTSILTGNITLTLPSQLSVQQPLTTSIQVQPLSTQTFWFTITPKGIEGKFPITLKLESPTYHDEIKQFIHVQPVGFPARLSFSAREMDKTMHISIHDAERNSLTAELTAFPDVLTDLFTGAEAILQEPHGCFEQVSSSTFPNLLALQFLKQTNLAKRDVEKLAYRYIKDGYNRLIAYEIKGGGFEWFGHPPAHEGLTAFGLLEFHEMKKVLPDVDQNMMNRTRDWLLGRRDGKGGFNQNAGKYGFSAASQEVNNAYITYALSETGTKDLESEYDKALAEAIKSKDMYRMALTAHTAFNLNKIDDYNNLLSKFKETVNTIGFSNIKIDHSIVRSYGTSLVCETISLWTIALMKSNAPDYAFIKDCIQQILKSRSYGQFGSTQATTLALKALTDYAQLVHTTSEGGDIQLLVDNKIVDKLTYEKEVRGKLIMNNFSKNLTSNGEQTVRVLFDNTKQPLPYSLNIQWHTKKPQSSDKCKVTLNTTLSAPFVRLNETARLTAILKNKSQEGLPMTVATIGIPAGLSAQPWQLKELQERQAFDFYEITNGNLILYYRELAPNAVQTINLDLKADIPGTYTAAASSAYLYYTNEYKDWVKGNSIEIRN